MKPIRVRFERGGEIRLQAEMIQVPAVGDQVILDGHNWLVTARVWNIDSYGLVACSVQLGIVG